MVTPTQPLRDEHKELLPHIETLRTLADSIEEVPIESLRRGVDEAYDFLRHHLVPHAQAEDAALYPIVGRVMGAPEATATMSRDHVEVGRLTEELGSLREKLRRPSVDTATTKGLRRVLYGLYALVKVHFAKEEELYLPLLDARISAQEAFMVFHAMEEVAKESKSHQLVR